MNTFSPANPHFFKVLFHGFQKGLKIPFSFSREVMRINEQSRFEVVLKMAGKEWKVDLEKEQFVGEGWEKFARDNRLRLCDFIVFKFMNPSLFQVWVFDGSSEMGKEFEGSEGPVMHMANRRYEPSTSEAFIETLPSHLEEVGDKVVPPSFLQTLKSFNENGCLLYFNLEFAQSNGLLRRGGEIALISQEGISWKFDLKKSGVKHVQITPCSRLADYMGLCGFKKGDRLKFEVLSAVKSVEPPTLSIKPWSSVAVGVPIVNEEPKNLVVRNKHKRSTDLGRDSSRLGSEYKGLSFNGGGNGDGDGENRASGSYQFPSFTSIVKRYCFTVDCFNIPLKFARQHGLTSNREMTLVDKMGGTWNAGLIKWGESNVRIVKGWKDFRDAEGIEEGDNLRFELLSSGPKPVARLTVMKA